MSRRTWLALVVAAAAAISAVAYFWSPQPAFVTDRPQELAVDPTPLTIDTSGGPKTFSIEVADDAGERTRGLMFREEMDDDRGMLFVFEAPQQVSFWMKDTPLPLDLLFIAQDGMIRAIEKGEPFSQASISPGEQVRFVLELKAGTAEREGIAVGDAVHHPVVDTAPVPANPG